jgi:CHAT domain-containing protein
VAYTISDSRLYALVATKRTASCWQLAAKVEDVRAAVHDLRAALKNTEQRVASRMPLPPVKMRNDQAVRPVLDPLFDLQSMLLAPLRMELAKTKTNSLIFVLPEELAGVPFHALAQDKTEGPRFLIQDYSVAYAVSGTFATLARADHGSLDKKTCRVAIFADSSGRVPGASEEAKAIQKVYKSSSVFRGATATAERFISAASSYNVVHIAAHHQADPNPTKVSIVLSGSPGGPGTVRFDDLMRIGNPSLELAELSACDTLSSSDTETAGAAYTAEVLALAGCPTVIGGLWKISDNASVRLMTSFYEFLGSTHEKAKALQLAQRSMVESKDGTYSHPFYWASFALYGDPH